MARSRVGWCARIACTAIVVAAVGAEGAAFADEIGVIRYELVSSKRVARTEYDYTYRIVLNSPGAAMSVSAIVTSSDTNTRILDGEVKIDRLAAGIDTVAADTITIRQNRLASFAPSALTWNFQHTHPAIPVAARYIVTSVIPVRGQLAHDVSYVHSENGKGWRINEMGQISGTAWDDTRSQPRHYFWSGNLIDVTSEYERDFNLPTDSARFGQGKHVMPEFSRAGDPRLYYLLDRPFPANYISGNIIHGHGANADGSRRHNYVWSWQHGIALSTDDYTDVGYGLLDVHHNGVEALGSVDFVGEGWERDASADFVIPHDPNRDFRYKTCMFGNVDAETTDWTARCLESPPGYSQTAPFDLNIHRSGVGFAFTAYDLSDYWAGRYRNSRAIKWDAAGSVQDLGVLAGDTRSAAYGLNDLGLVVGVSYSDSYDLLSGLRGRAFVGDASGIYDLTARTVDASGRASWNVTQAISINNSGQIVAYAHQAGATSPSVVILAPASLKAGDLAVENIVNSGNTLVTDPNDPHFGEVKVSYGIRVSNQSDVALDDVFISSRFDHDLPELVNREEDLWRIIDYNSNGFETSAPVISSQDATPFCNSRSSKDWNFPLGPLPSVFPQRETLDCTVTRIAAHSAVNLTVTFYVKAIDRRPELPGTIELDPWYFYRVRSSVAIDKPDVNLANNMVTTDAPRPPNK